jgi:hypothetical protein
LKPEDIENKNITNPFNVSDIGSIKSFIKKIAKV